MSRYPESISSRVAPGSECASALDADDPRNARLASIPFVGHAMMNERRAKARVRVAKMLREAAGRITVASACARVAPAFRRSARRLPASLNGLAVLFDATGDTAPSPEMTALGPEQNIRLAAACLREARRCGERFGRASEKADRVLRDALDALVKLDDMLRGDDGTDSDEVAE